MKILSRNMVTLDDQWLYCLCYSALGSLQWLPVALRDRITGKVYRLYFDTLTQEEAERGFTNQA